MCAAVADTTFFLEQAKDEALAGLPDTEFAGRAKDDDARRLLEKLAVKSVGTSSSGPRLSGIEPARVRLCLGSGWPPRCSPAGCSVKASPSDGSNGRRDKTIAKHERILQSGRFPPRTR